MADDLFAAFVVDQVTSGTLVPDVADSYVSHVLSHLENHLPRDVDVRRLARTPFLRDTMIGLRRHHSATHPRVDRRKIPSVVSGALLSLCENEKCGTNRNQTEPNGTKRNQTNQTNLNGTHCWGLECDGYGTVPNRRLGGLS